MATAEELLATTSETTEDPILTANWTTRTISIPNSIVVLGVEADDDTHRLLFKVPRYFGEFDLSTFVFQINYVNARNGEDVYPVDDLEIANDKENLTFSWLVDRFAYKYAGAVKFNICMKQYDSAGTVIKQFNTTFATLQVLEGLETEEAVVENNPSAFDQVMARLIAVETANELGKDGYYTIAKVEESAEGATITIINQDGTTEAFIRHGKDGHNPVKGTDYWTAADKEEMVNDTNELSMEYINTWAPRTVAITLTVDGWTDNRQTVTVAGVSDTNIIIVSPDPAATNYIHYVNNRVRCVEQTTNNLTFECETTPTSDCIVNIGVYYSTVDIA